MKSVAVHNSTVACSNHLCSSLTGPSTSRSRIEGPISPRLPPKATVASLGGSIFKLPSVSRSGLRPLWNAASAKMGYGASHDENKAPASQQATAPAPDKVSFVTGFLRTVSGASATSRVSDYKSAKSILKGSEGYDPEKEAIKVCQLFSHRTLCSSSWQSFLRIRPPPPDHLSSSSPYVEVLNATDVRLHAPEVHDHLL